MHAAASIKACTCCRWLREEARKDAAEGSGAKPKNAEMVLAEWSNGYSSGRMTSSLRHSSNAVMRM